MSDIFKVFDLDNKKCYTSLHRYFQENQERLGSEECIALKRVVEDKREEFKLKQHEYGVLLDSPDEKSLPSSSVYVLRRIDAENLYAQAMQGITVVVPPIIAPKKIRKRIPVRQL